MTIAAAVRSASIARASIRHALVPLVVLLAIATGACKTGRAGAVKAPTKGTTKAGVVLVDTPEVYARERLIVDRERQKRWLLEQLALPDAAFDVFEALVQARDVDTSSFRLGIDASPATAAAVRGADAATADLNRQAEIAELEHQIRMRQLELDLARIENGEPLAASNGSVAAGETATAGDGTDRAGPFPATAPAIGDLPPLPGLGLESPSARDVPISRLLQRLSYREIVRQELLENDLDDTHDLLGNTLYRLTFDTTVLPEWDTSAWAAVTVSVKTLDCRTAAETGDTSLRRLAEDWERHVSETLTLRAREAAQQHRAQLPTQIDLTMGVLLDRIGGRVSATEPVPSIAADEVASLYRQDLLASWFELTSRGDHVEARLRGPDRLFTLCNAIAALEPRVDTYAVTPKESVERISNIAGFETARQAALSLAAVAGTVGVDAAFDAARRADFTSHAIRRQPLVVGFSRGDGAAGASFGWILGPRFRPRPDAPGFDFRHAVVHQPLSAVVSVPAWWYQATLEVKTCWIEEDADSAVVGSPPCQGSTPQAMTVRLPADVAALTHALVPSVRRPLPQLVGTPELEVGRAERIAIRGENLWRNPMVYLGGQEASSVDILPDMRGLSARFDKVVQPAGWTPSQLFGRQEIFVWTSEGHAIAGTVQVHKPKEPPKATAPSAGFKVAATAPSVVESSGKGVIHLLFDLPQQPPSTAVAKVFVEVEGADLDAAASSGSCLVKNPIFEVTGSGSCSVDLGLRNLVKGKVVTIVTYRKEADKKIHHTPISREVR